MVTKETQTAADTEEQECELRFQFSRPSDDTLMIRIGGACTLGQQLPSFTDVERQMRADVNRIVFDSRNLSGWDTGLLTLLYKIIDHARAEEIKVEREGLPEGVQRLLNMAESVPETRGKRQKAEPSSLLAGIGKAAAGFFHGFEDNFTFIGEASLALVRTLGGKARFRRSDFFLILQECGPNALPIVSLISVLVGLILAFVGAVQLQMFGAQIYVANLVGLGMAREMGAMMAAVIMAGRTGAAFAAQLGTMQVNEEIDALTTLGISPMEFLVVPRMIALTLMMPLLCLYADLMGILGGALVGVSMLDLSLAAYFTQTREAVELHHFVVGVIKSGVFGVLVALAGCLRGMQCGRSATAVGLATTSAVVTAIVLIVVSDAILTVLFNILGI